MPMFTLWRSFDPTWTEADFERMNRRAISGIAWSTPIRWHRSYGLDRPGPAEGFCVYEADSLDEIEKQQRICRVPFTEARPVEEALGPGAGFGPDAAPDGWQNFLVERYLDPATTTDDLAASNATLANSNLAWVRSFWDAERGRARCIFAASSRQSLTEALAPSRPSADSVHPVVSNHPSASTELYDQLGLARHWES